MVKRPSCAWRDWRCTRQATGSRTAATCAGALALLDGPLGPLAVLVTDVVLPDGQGTELAIRARARDPGCKVIFMSGYAGPTDEVQQALGEGVRFLAKPFGPTELAREVAKLLAEGRAADLR